MVPMAPIVKTTTNGYFTFTSTVVSDAHWVPPVAHLLRRARHAADSPRRARKPRTPDATESASAELRASASHFVLCYCPAVF
jgi:hypothetical protein